MSEQGVFSTPTELAEEPSALTASYSESAAAWPDLGALVTSRTHRQLIAAGGKAQRSKPQSTRLMDGVDPRLHARRQP